MNGRELFNIWRLADINYWANFVKPSLFATATNYDFDLIDHEPIEPPVNIKSFNNRETAFIVDLPGDISVTAGLGLAKMGFMPVPLYCVVNESNTGGLKLAIDNNEILEALYDGVNILKSCRPELSEESAPAFLLDYRRLEEIPTTVGIYDNRWNVADLDFPSAEVLVERGITKVVLWTADKAHEDVVTVLNNYSLAGISVVQYVNEELLDDSLSFVGLDSETGVSITAGEVELYGKDIIKFEKARFALWFVLFFGVTNLVAMMAIWEEPWLWTVPSIMWLTYLWVPEAAGDLIAYCFVGVYIFLWKTSRKFRGNMLILLSILAIDTLVFYGYVIYYDITDWMYGLGWVALIAPIIIFLLGCTALDARKALKDLDYDKYMPIRKNMIESTPSLWWLNLRESSSSFSGYDGYGGSGGGGYRGSRSYRGYSSFGG